MNRIALVLLGLVGSQAIADPPDFPDPPVYHTNQGRNVDNIPQIDGEPKDVPSLGDDRQRLIWDPPVTFGDYRVDMLEELDFPVIGVGSLEGRNGQIGVTPSPGTIGLIGLGGLVLGGRRRRN